MTDNQSQVDIKKRPQTPEEAKLSVEDVLNRQRELSPSLDEHIKKVGEVEKKLSESSAVLTVEDAIKVLQLAKQISQGENDESKFAALKEYSDYQRRYGPNVIRDAQNMMLEIGTASSSFRTNLMYGLGQSYSGAAMVSDPTYTSVEQVNLGAITEASKRDAARMFDEYKKGLGEMPKYKPYSNDPNMNQIFIGMALQGAAGLLALIDSPDSGRIAAEAAAEIGHRTIDAMYDRYVKINEMNNELEKKYLDLVAKNKAGYDKAWETYFKGVMEANKNLANNFVKMVDNEYNTIINKIKARTDALKEEAEAAYKAGKLTKDEWQARIDALDKEADNRINYLKALLAEKSDAQRLGLLYAFRKQATVNKWMEKILPQVSTKDPEVISKFGPSVEFMVAFDPSLPPENIEQSKSGLLASIAFAQSIFDKYAGKIEEAMSIEDDNERIKKLDEIKENIYNDYINIDTPDEVKAKGEFFEMAFNSGVKAFAMKAYESVVKNQREGITQMQKKIIDFLRSELKSGASKEAAIQKAIIELGYSEREVRKMMEKIEKLSREIEE